MVNNNNPEIEVKSEAATRMMAYAQRVKVIVEKQKNDKEDK